MSSPNYNEMRSTKCLKGYLAFDAQIIFLWQKVLALLLNHDQAKVLTHTAENTMRIIQHED